MYRIFYNQDCAMYGVEQQVTDYMGTRYVQVLPPRKTQGARRGQSAYTHYMGIAIKWVNELQRLQRMNISVQRQALLCQRIGQLYISPCSDINITSTLIHLYYKAISQRLIIAMFNSVYSGNAIKQGISIGFENRELVWKIEKYYCN